MRNLLIGRTWPSQPRFESLLNAAAESTLKIIGYQGDAVIEIVSLTWVDHREYDLHVSGKWEGRDISRFLNLDKRASVHYQNHPDYALVNSDHPMVHAHERRNLQKHMRGLAICNILSELDNGDRIYFGAHPQSIEGAEVYVLLGLDRAVLDRTPRIDTTRRDHMLVLPSFVHATVNRFLRWAERALETQDPGSSPNVLDVTSADVARDAANWFVLSIFYCAGQFHSEGANELINAIAALSYEGRTGMGSLILGKKDVEGVEISLELLSPVALSNIRATRKLVEASGPQFSLLTDGEIIYGFGRLNMDRYDRLSESVFRIAIEERGLWSIAHCDTTLLRVQDGAPRLPQFALDHSYFLELVERVFDNPASGRLLELARAIGQPEHGAVLVVSSQAQQEVQRLGSQAWLVEPSVPPCELLTQLTSIDGAVLVDPTGKCYGIGVILDGIACECEDYSRGSRYNNSVRYVENAPPAVVVVYSSDGSVDILPRLNPRVSRTSVREAVERYCKAVKQHVSDEQPAGRAQAVVAEARKAINSYQFYLTREQCDIVNDARDVELAWEKKYGDIRTHEPDVAPNSRMNDTYFID